MVVSAKSIGAGMPISAVTGKAEMMDAPHLGGIGGTYGGSPVACVAAIEAIKIIKSESFPATVPVKWVKSSQHDARAGKRNTRIIGDVRGIGAMQLVEFVKDRNY